MIHLKDLFNKGERPVAIAMLKSARKMLNPGMGEFVCCNLTSSASEFVEGSVQRRAVHTLREEIRERLEGCGTVCQWLREKHDVPNEDIKDRDGWRLVEYRQAWVDSMIEELR